MILFLKKILSITLIVSIFSTNVFAITGKAGSDGAVSIDGNGTVLENNSKNNSSKKVSETKNNQNKNNSQNKENKNLEKNNNSKNLIESKIFPLKNSGKNNEGKLFAILLEKNLSKDSKILEGVKKYGEEIQKKFPQYSSKIYLIDKNENQNSIFSKLEYLYFNGEKKGDKINFLNGIFLIGDLPIPDIQINDGFETKKSFFPYTDFENKFFVFNNEKKFFTRQKEVSKAKAEIFSGFLREKKGEENKKFYENYFEKLNNFYKGGVKNFSDNKIFFADLNEEKKSANQTLLGQYEKEKKFLYEISYKKFSNEFAKKLQGEILKNFSKPVCTTNKNCIKCKEGETCKGETEGILSCEKGYKISKKEETTCSKVNTTALTKSLTGSNLIAKFQVEKLLPEYTKTVQGYIQKSNDLIFKSGEDKDNLKTIPVQIFIKDFIAKEYIKKTNQLIENNVYEKFKNYTDDLENKIFEDLKKGHYYNNDNNRCVLKNETKKILNHLNTKHNLPTKESEKKAIEDINMDLKVDIRNKVSFRKNWYLGNYSYTYPEGCSENCNSNNGGNYNCCTTKTTKRYFLNKDGKKYEFYLPNLFQSKGNIINYQNAYVPYLNGITSNVGKIFSKNLFQEIIYSNYFQNGFKNYLGGNFSEKKFKYYYNWLQKNADEKRKTILEEKIFSNVKENFYKDGKYFGEDGEKKENFSLLYFRSGKFGNGENLYIKDLEKGKNSKIRNNNFKLPDFGMSNAKTNKELGDKCGSYNGVPLPEWFDAVKCWLKDIKESKEKTTCGGGSKESWKSFWNGEQFKNSIGNGSQKLNGKNEDLKIFSYPENFSGPINQEEKILLESKNSSGTEKNFFETFTISETEGIKILNKDTDSEKAGIQIQGLSNFTSLNFKILKKGNYKIYISGKNSIGTEIKINGYEKLFFSAKQKKLGIIKEGAYNSVLLDFFIIDENGKKVDFTGYAKLKFKDGKNGLINNEDLFFENGKATTGIISKEKDPTLIIYGNGIKKRNLNLHFSKSWLAKDLIQKEKIPENVKKIDINGSNFYSAFLIGKEYANLKNGIAFKLLEKGKALSIATSMNNYKFYNEDSDTIENYNYLKKGIEKNLFGVGFGDETKSVMKFLSGDFIGNSIKDENGIFSVILGDPMISFKNEKNPNEFTKSIGKNVYRFSGDIDKIKIIDFNSDGQKDFLAFMKDGFIKLFKGDNGSFIKKGDLAFFSSNVKKSFIGDVNNDGKDDFILKLYDGREIFFENKGDGKFKKNILSESIIEKFLNGKTEKLDIKKNILGENNVKNTKYGKKDVQKILADERGIDTNLEYKGDEQKLSTEEELNKEIGEINGKLNKAVNFVTNLTCMGGSCIGLPVNRAFLAPGAMTIPFNVGGMPIAYIGGPIPGTPAFGMTLYPGSPPVPGACAGATCYFGTPGIPLYRNYISPTITGGLGYAYCTGPAVALNGAGGMCFITALPVNQLGICKQQDPFGDAVQKAVQDFNRESQSFKSGGKDGKDSNFTQALGSGGVPENEDAYASGLNGTKIQIFDENNRTMNPFFSGFLTRWMDKQIKEISVNMLQLPTIKLILPNLGSGLKSIENGWSNMNLIHNDKIFNFSSNLNKEKKKLEKYQKSLDTKNLKNDKKGLFPVIKTKSGTFLGQQSFNRGKGNLNGVSKTIEESYDEIFKEIEKLPILQLKREKIDFIIPWINPYKLNSLIFQINDFIQRHEKILKDLPKDQFIYLRNYIKQLKKNLEVLKTYRDFPQEIMKYRFLLSQYIGEVIDIIDCIQDYLGGWIIKNKKIVITYIKLYYLIKQIIKAITNLSSIFEDYKSTCSACKANTYLSNFSLAQLLMYVIPEPPVIKMPKLPDIKLDLSDIQLGIVVNIPEINFKVREIYLPGLNLPTLAFDNLNLPIYKLPPAPKLPDLPEIPAIKIPKLPDLPPAPKLPEFPSWITDLTDTIRLVLKLYCLIFEQGLFVYPENTVKQVIEGLTNRSSSNYLPLDFLFLQFPNISYSTIREIQVNTHLNLNFEDKTMYNSLKKDSKNFNQNYKKLQNDINSIIGEFNEKAQKEGERANEKTQNTFKGLNKDLNGNKSENQNGINNSVKF